MIGNILVDFRWSLKFAYFLLIIVILLMRNRYEREIEKVQNDLKDKFQKR